MTMLAFYTPALNSIINFAKQDDNDVLTCPITGDLITSNQVAALRKRYPDVVMMDADQAEKLRESAYCTNWQEITKERFIDMLNTLYPLDWVSNIDTESFKFAERYSDNITTIFARLGSRYFECRGDLRKSHYSIIESIKNYTM